MAILLELLPEQEEKLKEAAEIKGLTVEGYLLTLVEAIVQPRPATQTRTPLVGRTLGRLFRKGGEIGVGEIENPDQVVRESIRAMRKSVLEYKEKAVDAVTTMNMLRSAVEAQERQIAEREVRALRALAEEKQDQAKGLWQEKTVLENHLEAVQRELYTATSTAAERMRAFRQEEERAQARATQAQAAALKAHEAVMLPPDRIAPLIRSLYTEAEWELKFAEWVLAVTQDPAEANLPNPIPVDDAQAFEAKALNWAKETRSIPETEETVTDDSEWEAALDRLAASAADEQATPPSTRNIAPSPDEPTT